jgi:hypothetical protein
MNRPMRVCFVVAVLSLLALSAASAQVARSDKAVTLSSEDLVARFGFPAVTKSFDACQPITQCGPAYGYGSCASWSSYTECGDLYCSGTARGCGACGEICVGRGWEQQYEAYRICFNQFGESCTQWARFSDTVSCGDCSW